MTSQLNYTSDNSEFSDLPPAEAQLASGHRDESDSDDLSFTSNEDERAARVAPAPVTEDEKKVARAAAALKKAQQDAAQSEHCVFGAKAAHLELARVHAKKIRTAELAVQRLRAAKRSASTGALRHRHGQSVSRPRRQPRRARLRPWPPSPPLRVCPSPTRPRRHLRPRSRLLGESRSSQLRSGKLPRLGHIRKRAHTHSHDTL